MLIIIVFLSITAALDGGEIAAIVVVSCVVFLVSVILIVGLVAYIVKRKKGKG